MPQQQLHLSVHRCTVHVLSLGCDTCSLQAALKLQHNVTADQSAELVPAGSKPGTLQNSMLLACNTVNSFLGHLSTCWRGCTTLKVTDSAGSDCTMSSSRHQIQPNESIHNTARCLICKLNALFELTYYVTRHDTVMPGMS